MLKIRVMSTSTVFHARAVSMFEATMCSAIAFRMWETWITSSGPVDATAYEAAAAAGACSGAAAGAGAAGAGGATVGCGAGVAGGAEGSGAARTSCLVMRPPVPLPRTVARSIPRSVASLRTSGERTPRNGSSAAGTASAARAAGATVWLAAAAAGWAGVGAGGEAATARGRGGRADGGGVTLEPPRDGALDEGRSELGHRHLGRHGSLGCCRGPVPMVLPA